MDDGRIVRDPDVMLGKPTVRGTRITVEYIIGALASGATIDQLVEGHRRLTRADVTAALEFAAEAE